MHALQRVSEVLLWSLIIAVALLNLAVYTGIVRGEEAIDVLKVPAGGLASTTPGASPTSDPATLSVSQRAELDDGDDLPGRFVPTQGRQHLQPYPDGGPVEFCPENEISDECYGSNPPTSGLHYPVQGTVTLAGGNQVRLPPDPGVYDFPIPREAIPHIQEHAGVYAGFNCAGAECAAAAARLTSLVEQELSLGRRVVLSPDPDLPVDTISLASWTRVDAFRASEYNDARAQRFIAAHSCRFDPEGFCEMSAE